MGIYQKIDNGNYMGDAGKREAKKEGSGKPESKEFKRGQIDDLPNRSDNFPKAGKDLAPSFQDMRNNDIRKGRV